jgi:hypothetical protein
MPQLIVCVFPWACLNVYPCGAISTEKPRTKFKSQPCHHLRVPLSTVGLSFPTCQMREVHEIDSKVLCGPRALCSFECVHSQIKKIHVAYSLGSNVTVSWDMVITSHVSCIVCWEEGRPQNNVLLPNLFNRRKPLASSLSCLLCASKIES